MSAIQGTGEGAAGRHLGPITCGDFATFSTPRKRPLESLAGQQREDSYMTLACTVHSSQP